MTALQIIRKHAYIAWMDSEADETERAMMALDVGRAALREIKATSTILIIWTIYQVMFWIWWLYSLWSSKTPKEHDEAELAFMESVARSN